MEQNQKKPDVVSKNLKKWYLSLPVIIVSFIFCFPISIILTVIRFSSIKKQSKGYRIGSCIALILHAFLVGIFIWALTYKEPWVKEFESYIEQQNYEEAMMILDGESHSKMTLDLVNRYYEVAAQTNDYSKVVYAISQYYDETENKAEFNEKILNRIKEKEELLVAGDKEKIAVIESSIAQAKEQKAIELLKEESRIAEEASKAEESRVAMEASKVEESRIAMEVLEAEEMESTELMERYEDENEAMETYRLDETEKNKQELEESLTYKTIFTCTYPKKFKSKRGKMLKLLQSLDGRDSKTCDAYLEIESKLFKGKSYKQTVSSSDYSYFGKMKNNRPHGEGILLHHDMPIYVGGFKEGKFKGYGFRLTEYGIVEEGEYEDGVLHGEGIIYYDLKYDDNSEVIEKYNDNYDEEFDELMNSKNKEKIDSYINQIMINYPVVDPSVRIEGKFKDGKSDGKKVKEYYSNYIKRSDLLKTNDLNYGSIYYEGEKKKGEYEGEGKLYYANGQIKYKGGFRNGTYHGKGTLYEKDGNIKYKGKFKYGDAA